MKEPMKTLRFVQATTAALMLFSATPALHADQLTATEIGEKVDEKIATMKKNLQLSPEQEARVRAVLQRKI